MKLAIVYTSKTGNTKELMELFYQLFRNQQINAMLYRVEKFPLSQMNHFDVIIIGTYSWGNGEIPREMMPLYQAFECVDVKSLVTGVAGTGDSVYPRFCGAVDEFRDMLYVRSDLAVTLKVELTAQEKDVDRCKKFIDLLLKRFVNSS